MFKIDPSAVKLETSLINNKNNKGPNTEPWRSPMYILLESRGNRVRNIQLVYDFLIKLRTDEVHYQ